MGSKAAPKQCVIAPPECGCIEIRGAAQNNLKQVDLDLPLNQLTVITGPSGSGKSSLAFDTIYAEGQRRYVETFSPYMRQFLDRMDKPRVQEIRGIPPAIAIEQANPVKSSRSTVGTMTEINDYLKLLWPAVARGFCPNCGREVKPETAASITEQVLAEFGGRSVLITFWVTVPAGREPKEFFAFLQQQGYLRVYLDRKVVRVDSDPKVKRLGARVQVIQDRTQVSPENKPRLAEALEIALRFGKDRVNVVEFDAGKDGVAKELPFSTGWHCAHCDLDIRPPTPGLFSFNNPLGACPQCRGFGRTIAIDLNKALPDRSLSIKEGVVRVFRGQEFGESQKDLLRACAREEVDINLPFEELPKADQDFVINGEGSPEDDYDGRWYGVRGFFRWLESNTYKMHVRVLLSRYRAYVTCPGCNGTRFQPDTLNYRIVSGGTGPVANRINGKREAFPPLSLPEFQTLAISRACEILQDIEVREENGTAGMLRREICSRLDYLRNVGLGYLTLDRSTRTLSGGEVQRVNLTTCLGASLVNTLFVMDEPSVGLHPRDVGRLIQVMHDLRDKGNTLLVVEHEESIIRSADNLIDIGPGRGESGGELVYSGKLIDRIPNSLTGDYLSGEKRIVLPKSRRKPASAIKVAGARAHNLKNVDIEIPLGVFVCVTGVSGSGKSTLVHDILYRNLMRAKGETTEQEPGACRSVTGAHRVGDIVGSPGTELEFAL